LGESLQRATLDLIELRSGDFERAATRDRVQRALADTRARLAIEGPGNAVGPILVIERRRLGSPDVIEKRLEEVREQITQTQLQQIDVSDQRRSLSDLGEAVDQALDRAEAGDDAEAASLRGKLYELLDRRAELLPKKESVLQRFMTALAQAEIDLQQQLSDTRVLQQMLDEQVYWLPSNPSIDRAWFSRLPGGWADLLKPSRFATSTRLFVARVIDAPLLPAILIIALIALTAVRLQARGWIAALSPPLRRPAEDDLQRTLKVLGITAAAALPWALLVGGVGRILELSGEPGRFSDSLGYSLRMLAVSVFVLEFLRFMAIERGLAHLHFRWMTARRRAMRRTLTLGYSVLLP
jgi:potassium efflux system protein